MVENGFYSLIIKKMLLKKSEKFLMIDENTIKEKNISKKTVKNIHYSTTKKFEKLLED